MVCREDSLDGRYLGVHVKLGIKAVKLITAGSVAGWGGCIRVYSL